MGPVKEKIEETVTPQEVSIDSPGPTTPANLTKLTKEAFPQKLEKDAEGRLIDPKTRQRVRYVIQVDRKGTMKIQTPGDVFEDTRGRKYCVQPDGSIRRLKV